MTLEEKKRLYDNQCKEVLAEKHILANIMQGVMPEFKSLSIDDIAYNYIEGNPAIGSVPVIEQNFSHKISGLSNESNIPGEGVISYDVKFSAILPKPSINLPEDKQGTPVPLEVLVNVETQNEFYPGYPLEKRGIFYASRLISAQYGTIFSKSEYQKLRKVYSIWICPTPPKRDEYTITEYSLREINRSGQRHALKENYDLLTVIFITLGTKSYQELTGLHRLLNAIFLDKIEPIILIKLLNEEFNITITPSLSKGVNNMCNLSEGVYARGMSQGIAKGETNMIKNLFAAGAPLDLIEKASGWDRDKILALTGQKAT